MKGVVGVAGHKRQVDLTCNVVFICPKCRREWQGDAYEGPARHAACDAWLIPLRVVVDEEAKEFLHPVGMPAHLLERRNQG